MEVQKPVFEFDFFGSE